MEGESKTRYGLLPVLYLIFGSLVLPFLYFDNLIDPVIIAKASEVSKGGESLGIIPLTADR